MEPTTDIEQFRRTWEIARASGVCDDEFEPWLACFKAATLWPINHGGEQVGTLLMHGLQGEPGVMLHFVILPEWEGRWVTKSMLRAFRGWRPGVPLLTLVKQDDPVRVKAAGMIGFKPLKARAPVLGHDWYVRA